MSAASGRRSFHAELRELARRVSGEAAELIRERRARGFQVAGTKTSATDVVTDVDRACERLIRSRLLAARPDDGFLGEESGASADSGDTAGGVRWLVDPIDGTVNFVSGFPEYAVSIAAEIDGEAVAGVVRHVPTGTTYAASLGGGATRDGAPLGVPASRPLDQALVATGFSYDRRVRTIQAAACARLLPRIGDIRRAGSCALDLCHVATGAVHAYVEEGVNPWDHAAGGLIARECGGRTEIGTGAGGLTLLMCAPIDVFDEFREAVRETGFLDG
ncbi:MAG: inositol monophosphatase family protein [Nocardioides sp.]